MRKAQSKRSQRFIILILWNILGEPTQSRRLTWQQIAQAIAWHTDSAEFESMESICPVCKKPYDGVVCPKCTVTDLDVTGLMASEGLQVQNTDSGASATAFLVDLVSNRKIPITTPRCKVGRDDLNDIVISGDQSISRFHFVINYDNGQYTVQDGKSRHGTFLNGNQITAAESIHDGDVLKVGVSLFWFVIEAQVAGSSQDKFAPVDVEGNKASEPAVVIPEPAQSTAAPVAASKETTEKADEKKSETRAKEAAKSDDADKLMSAFSRGETIEINLNAEPPEIHPDMSLFKKRSPSKDLDDEESFVGNYQMTMDMLLDPLNPKSEEQRTEEKPAVEDVKEEKKESEKSEPVKPEQAESPAKEEPAQAQDENDNDLLEPAEKLEVEPAKAEAEKPEESANSNAKPEAAETKPEPEVTEAKPETKSEDAEEQPESKPEEEKQEPQASESTQEEQKEEPKEKPEELAEEKLEKQEEQPEENSQDKPQSSMDTPEPAESKEENKPVSESTWTSEELKGSLGSLDYKFGLSESDVSRALEQMSQSSAKDSEKDAQPNAATPPETASAGTLEKFAEIIGEAKAQEEKKEPQSLSSILNFQSNTDKETEEPKGNDKEPQDSSGRHGEQPTSNGAKSAMSIVKESSSSTVPDWCKKYFSTELNHLNKELSELSEQVRLAQQKIKEVESRVAMTKGLRNTLLTAQGDELVEACGKVLTMLGFKTIISDEDKHELRLEQDDKNVSIARIVWTDQQPDRTHLGQLSISQTRYWCEKGIEPKGVLVIGKSGGEAPAALSSSDYNGELAEYASKKNVCLMTTLQLLAVYKEVALNEGSAESVRSTIHNCNGWLPGYVLEPGAESADRDEPSGGTNKLSSLLSA
jgi:pSer/pThr/pTyr-binding forkhead associated (FHA) protein